MEDVAAQPHVGSRIKEIRAWRDVSLRAVAELAGISPGFLSMVENGERSSQQRKHLEAIARALRIAPTELGALPTTGVVDPDVSRALDGLVEVEAALTDVALGEQTVTPRPWPAIAADVENLQNALRPRADIPEQMAILPRLIRELNALVATDPANRRQVLEALIHVLHSASMAAKYVGAHGTPGLGALRMREVAEELEQPRYVGLAKFARSQTLASARRERMRELSVEAADELQSHIGSDEPARQLYGMLHLNGALACAALSDADGAFSHLQEARETAERAPDPEGTGWACLSFNRTNVQFWQVALTIELGDPGRVAELRESIVPEQMASWSRQGAYHADLGRALAMDKGTRDDAVMALVRAEQLSPVSTRANVWVRETVRDLLVRMKRDAAVGRELRGMAYRMGLAA
jgi:transcriptional regulator with XRE-family HTH domain